MSDLAIVGGLCAFGVLVSGLFSGAETGAYRFSRTRHRLLLGAGDRRARRVEGLTRDLTAFVVVCLIGTNLGNTLVSYCTTLALEQFVSSPELVATLTIGPVLFLLGEVAPKELFRRHPNRLLYGISPVLIVSAWLFTPATRALRGLTAFLSWLGLDAEEGNSARHARDRVRQEIAAGRAGGTLTDYQATLARNIFSLEAKRVRHAMIPLSEVGCLEAATELEEARGIVRSQGHTRYPVFRDQRGQVIGLVHAYDLLFEERPGLTIRNYVRPILRVAPQDPVAEAILRLRRARSKMAVVVQGELALGVVTLKDLIEEITGELNDL